MSYAFNDLVDIDKLKDLCENYTQITHTVTAILDLEGNVLVASGWQDICTRFHRRHPVTAKRCRESDTVLAGQLRKGEKFNVYQCKNGLVDVAVPICVNGAHVGNLFTGQFFFEPPDVDFFRRQAKAFHFDEAGYLDALKRVPIFNREQMIQTTGFLCQLSELIGEMGLARMKLSNQTELLNNILENIPLNVFWKDTASVYLGCNRAFAETAGLKAPESIIGKTDYDLPWTKAEADFYRRCDRQVVETGSAMVDLEQPLTQADGRRKTVVASKVPLKNQDNTIFGALGICYDITERKQMEEDIRQAQKMDSLGTLAGGIAHEFNNILGAMLGYVEIAKEDATGNSPVLESLDKILKLGIRARDIVRQILSFSRKEKQKKQLFQPHRLIAEELKVLRATIPATVKIRHSLDETAGTVLGDQTQIQQVVMNICANAAHAMEEKGGVLDLSLSGVVLDAEDAKSYSDLEPGEYIQLTVSDTGTGIDADIIDKIFDPFFTTKGVGKGTGMGLSVVHGIVKNHGGAISVSSRAGQGAIFTVLLPKADGMSGKASLSKPVPTGTESILIVDDEEHMAFPQKKILERLGYRVSAMTSSLDALALFKKNPQRYDLVITDLTMPNLTGDRLASEITAIRPDLPVILATGYTDAMDSQKIQQSGIAAFISKPFTTQDLARTVRLLLDEE